MFLWGVQKAPSACLPQAGIPRQTRPAGWPLKTCLHAKVRRTCVPEHSGA